MKKTLLTAAIIALMSGPSMALDFTQVLTNPDGSPITAGDGKDLKPPTLGSICETALLSTYADEKDASGKETITGQEKFDRWKLAGKVHGKDVTLSPEELAKIKMLVGKAFLPLIVGQAWSMLDPTLNK